jgi:hypothetical protein
MLLHRTGIVDPGQRACGSPICANVEHRAHNPRQVHENLVALGASL